ncbi:MAG: hypothetical protein WC815_20025 [Vicinamibacterales bacterium]|jgi:hypothetical protein
MQYEVQHYTLFYGWVNTWAYAEADGVMHPERFATAKEAKAALDEFFEDLEEEVAAGQMAAHDRDEFRVRPVAGIGISGRLDAAGGAP